MVKEDEELAKAVAKELLIPDPEKAVAEEILKGDKDETRDTRDDSTSDSETST